MDIVVRKPFQGVTNIVRFNWHFYVIAGTVLFLVVFAGTFFSQSAGLWITIFVVLVSVPLLVSLIVSCYVYDFSHFYDLEWMNSIQVKEKAAVININAGFDETSALVAARYPRAVLKVFDFYNPAHHTEVSIRRARKAYPPYPETTCISTSGIPIENASVDLALNIFALHEIRDEQERINFLKCQYTALTNGGSCMIVEHLRDTANFLAYTIGFLHFHSLKTWHDNFIAAGFSSVTTKKINPFVTLFILTKHD